MHVPRTRPRARTGGWNRDGRARTRRTDCGHSVRAPVAPARASHALRGHAGCRVRDRPSNPPAALSPPLVVRGGESAAEEARMAQTIPNPGPAGARPARTSTANGWTAIASRSSSRRSRPAWSRIGGWARPARPARPRERLDRPEHRGGRGPPVRSRQGQLLHDRARQRDRVRGPDLLLARGIVSSADHRHGRGLLVRVVQMLTRLTARHAS